MKTVAILSAIVLLAVYAFAQADASSATIPRVELEKLTVRHLFDVTYATSKDQKILSAKVISVSPKTEEAGVSFGDELVNINGKPIKGLEIAEFQVRMQAHEATTFTFRRKPSRLGKSSLRELTLMPVPQDKAASLAPKSSSKDGSRGGSVKSTPR